MSAPRLLLVGSAGERVDEQLSADGFDVSPAHSLGHARELIAAPWDLIVLGRLDGAGATHELLRQARADGSAPVVAFAERGDEVELLRLFELGADDVAGWPVSYFELRARAGAVLRRSRPSAPRRLRVGTLEIDLAARAVQARGAPVRLSRMEFELLSTLAADPGRVFTKEELLRRVWGFRSLGATRTLDSHACRLRRKLGGAVVTVWGVGYRLAG